MTKDLCLLLKKYKVINTNHLEIGSLETYFEIHKIFMISITYSFPTQDTKELDVSSCRFVWFSYLTIDYGKLIIKPILFKIKEIIFDIFVSPNSNLA